MADGLQGSKYQQQVRALSEQLIALQKPIRILDSIKWSSNIEREFFAQNAQALPRLGQDYYQKMALGFEPAALRAEFKDLHAQVGRKLGLHDGLARILCATIEQYLLVIDLLEARGSAEFGSISQELYGSASDTLRGDTKTLRELGEQFSQVFSLPAAVKVSQPHQKTLDAQQAVSALQRRLDRFFDQGELRVILSDGIVSDAAAGGDYIKVNQEAFFSERDLHILEVHEGWVHVGTTLNGRLQPYATWLSVGSPRVTACQEGLAVLMEILSFSSHPQRALKVSDRVVAVDMAENGADFLEVYRYFVARGRSEGDSYKITQRVFRGGTLTGGSVFTKDISYLRGLVENVNFIRSAINSGIPEIIPLLFVGKVALDDVPLLYERYLESSVLGPHYIPEMFRDMGGLYSWFGFSSGLAGINVARVQAHFEQMFAVMKKPQA
ncbi:MAG: flavohemoglobin expression-modulating QEGLA motif protein [Pseudohongiellaceae bacterium]|nr:flavohemoglobin expression-modulating QEGLA motif protein [Pseudohongiellaceae bacterium]